MQLACRIRGETLKNLFVINLCESIEVDMDIIIFARGPMPLFCYYTIIIQ